MSAKMTGIDTGLKVYGSDGEDLGTISRIWTEMEETPTSPQDYVVVCEGGFLGIGERTLYIPFTAVETVIPDESVTVNESKQTCIDLYTSKPEGIKKKEAAIAAAVIAATTPVIFHT